MALKRKPKAESPAKTPAKTPEPKAEPKAPEPTVVESFDVSGSTVCLNGQEFTFDSQETFLGLRRAINDQAAGLVH